MYREDIDRHAEVGDRWLEAQDCSRTECFQGGHLQKRLISSGFGHWLTRFSAFGGSMWDFSYLYWQVNCYYVWCYLRNISAEVLWIHDDIFFWECIWPSKRLNFARICGQINYIPWDHLRLYIMYSACLSLTSL